MRIKRSLALVTVGAAAVAALAGCSQAHVAPRPAASQPAVSVSGCVTAMEKAGEDALVQGAGSGKLPAPVARACAALSAAETNAAVNVAMTHLMGAAS